MQNHTSRLASIARTTSMVAMVLTLGAPSAFAQELSRRPVRLLLPTEFPKPDARALVVRYASEDKGDVLVLDPKSLTLESFVAAIAVLRDLRKAEPMPTNDIVATVSGFVTLKQIEQSRRARLARLLAALKSQAISRLGNLGRGQWVDLPESAISS